MRDQQIDPLNDDLAREIEQALAVEPSPDFEARVRQSVAQEPALANVAFAWWRPALWPAPAVIAATVIITAGWQLGSFSSIGNERARVEPTRIQDEPGSKQQPVQSAARPMTPQAATTLGPTAGPGVRSVQPPSTMATLDWLVPVIVAEDEIAGMRALIADAQAGRFESVVVTEQPVLAVVAVPPPAADASERPSSETTSASTSHANAAELARTGTGQDMAQGRPPQIASAVLVRPLAIEPLNIKPLVSAPPDEKPEGAAE